MTRRSACSAEGRAGRLRGLLASRRPATLLALALSIGACGGGEREHAPEEAAATSTAGAVDVAQEAGRVQIGMTEDQVRRILGEPRTRVGEGEGERLTFWSFDAQQRVSARVYVTLDREGRVVNVETI